MNRDIYWPPKEVIAKTAKKLAISTDGGLKYLISIGAGVMRWALNDISVSRTGVEWVHSAFGIEESIPHKFFKYSIDDVPISNFTILSSSGIAPVMPSSGWIELENSMRELGLLGLQESIQKRETRELLIIFSSYIKNDPIIFNGKCVTDIYKTVKEVRMSTINAVARVIRSTNVSYEPFETVDVTNTYACQCQECDYMRPCVQSTSSPVCKRCLAKANPMEDTLPCEHIECSSYGCSFSLNPFFDDPLENDSFNMGQE